MYPRQMYFIMFFLTSLLAMLGANLALKSPASKCWRISISDSSPGIGLGQRLTQSIASCSDLHFQSQNPATSSFVSVKGPSITVRFSPENLTRAPFELG